MIRTFVRPTKKDFKITLNFPDDYLGEEIEIIAFKKQEGLPKEKSKLSDKYRGIISKEQGNQLNEHIKEIRNDWNNI